MPCSYQLAGPPIATRIIGAVGGSVAEYTSVFIDQARPVEERQRLIRWLTANSPGLNILSAASLTIASPGFCDGSVQLPGLTATAWQASLDYKWAKGVTTGFFTGKLTDLQGRFCLSTLAGSVFGGRILRYSVGETPK